MRNAVLVAWLAGCSFDVNARSDASDSPGSEAGSNVTIDARACFGSGSLYTLCLDTSPPTTDETLTGDVNTDTDAKCLSPTPAMWIAANQPDSCIVVGQKLTVTTVIAHGNRPLVLLASDAVILNGLDVASKHGRNPGAGSQPCTVGGALPTSTANGGGGGAGGSFVTLGGSGGQGDNGTNADGGTPVPLVVPGVLRGGCHGQVGAAAGSQAGGGEAGSGGGAVFIVAGNKITISGSVNASGGGASGSPANKGGGGGAGAGGMIVMFAPAITALGATIFANGGGGGAGSPGTNVGDTGAAATDPTAIMAQGAGGTAGAGTGGAGSVSSSQPGNGTGGSGGHGGGGGGGSTGFIAANVTLAGGPTVSPLASSIP